MALVTSCSLLASISSSDAVIVTVDNIEYEITKFNSTWNSSSTLLKAQPWYWSNSLSNNDNIDRVYAFANAAQQASIGGQTSGSAVGAGNGGPFFVYNDFTAANYSFYSGNVSGVNLNSYKSSTYTFAKATARGGSQDFPILPTSPTVFTGPSGAWFDPIAAIGFDFTMTDGNLFNSIDDFPTLDNLDTTFDVWTGGTSLGTFGPGDSVDFVTILGNGVSEFSITGIDPAVDGEDPLVFPIQLSFNSGTGSFTMVAIPAVPEPSSTALLGLGGLALMLRRRR